MPDSLTSPLAKPLQAARAGFRAPGRPLLWVAALALLGGGVLYARRGQDILPLPEPPAAAGREAVRPAPAGGAVDAAVAPSRAQAQPQPALTPAQQLRERFERSDDLYRYAQDLQPAVRAGDADATWMYSQVQDYCSSYASSPANYGRDTQAIAGMGLRTSAAMTAARNRVSARCARFSPNDDLSYASILGNRLRAAKAGNLAAEASLLTMDRPLQGDDTYIRDLIERVRTSLDPDAYFALSPRMGIASSGKRDFYGPVSGSQFSELAWQLAACRLGLPCGPNSVLMTNYCANGGICSQDPEQDFDAFVFDAAVPRQGATVLNGLVDGLVGGERTKR